MPRRCTVCACAAREDVDAALVAGEPYRRIAARYGLSETAVRRHKADHLPAALASASEAAAVARGDDLLGQARELQARALRILDRAEDAGDLRTAVSACREVRGVLELLSRLLGELPDGPTVNVVLTPEWSTLRAHIITALTPYPDARLAVAAALEVPGAVG